MRYIRQTGSLILGGLVLGAFLIGPLRGEDAAHPPRPVAIWAAGLLEVRVAFDRPIDPATAIGAVGKSISLREDSLTAEHQGTLQIAAARLEDDGFTLVLTTDPHARVANYTLSLTNVKGRGATGVGETLNLTYDLTGVNAAWDLGKEGSKPSWSGWWPSLDTETSRQLTRGSSEHERGYALLNQPGRLTLSAMLLLKGKGTLTIQANGPFEALLAGEEKKSESTPGGAQQLSFRQDWTGDMLDLTLTLRTGTTGAPLSVHATFRDESRAGATDLPLARSVQFVSWAPPLPPPPSPAAALPDLAGGDRVRGEAAFFGDAAKCASCHKIHGKGGTVGPDLSEHFRRDRAQLYRDIAEPSAVIHPDFVPYTIALKNGQVVAGIVRAEGADALRVTNADAKAQIIPRADVEEIRPSATSIMPVGLAGALGEATMRDLMAFLTSPEKLKN